MATFMSCITLLVQAGISDAVKFALLLDCAVSFQGMPCHSMLWNYICSSLLPVIYGDDFSFCMFKCDIFFVDDVHPKLKLQRM